MGLLLTDLSQAVLASKHRSGPAGETIIVSAIVATATVVVIVCIGGAPERSGSYRAGGADCSADHARGYIGWPEATITVIDACAVLLLTDDLRPRSCAI